MDKLISDRAQVEISSRVQSILCGYSIDSWQSDPHYQHKNFAERRYTVLKPLLTGSTPDINSLLCFQFWEPVYYRVDNNDFPSESKENLGHVVGISKHVGHALTFKVLTDDTKKVVNRSRICSALNPKELNQWVGLKLDDSSPKVLQSKHKNDLENGKVVPTLDPTKEKFCIGTGPEFGELEGHTLAIVKALYRFRSSGLHWHERFADILHDMGFFPSKV